MEELDVAAVKKRSIRGVFALVSRTLVIQVVSFFIGNLLLPLYLSPSVYGVFFVVSAFIGFLSYFSDIGLAASLVQKKEEVTREDLATTFTIQQTLIIAIVAVAFFATGYIGEFYHLTSDGILLFKALLVAFFLSSLKTIPSVILERKLLFNKLVIPQILETITFNAVALFFAISGAGINSFTYAVLARGIVGLVAIYSIAPWRIEFGFSKPVAKKLLSFGIPFQTNSILALVKDDLLTIYLGKVLPFSQIGYIGFAQKWAFSPLRLIMDNIIRITFPSFSRLQHNSDALSKAVEKSLFASVFFIFPSSMGLLILMPYFIHVVPKYEKWEGAIISLSFFCINAMFSSISTPLTNALNAVEKINVTLKLMIFWTVATWILTPLAIPIFGFHAVAGVSALVAVSVVIVIYIARKIIPFRVMPILFAPTIATIVMSIFLVFVSPFLIKDIPTIIGVVGLGGILYLGVIYVLAKNQVMADIVMIRDNLFR